MMNEIKEGTKTINAPVKVTGAVYEVTLNYRKISAYGGKVNSSEDAYRIIKAAQSGCDIERKEYFHAIFLKRNNEVLAVSQISVGGWSGTIADGKIIFAEALICGAQAIILSHNHPSGTLKASEADKVLTRKMCEFGKMIELPILDHLITTAEGFYMSFCDEGLL